MARAPKSTSPATSPMSPEAFALSPHAAILAGGKWFGSAEGKSAMETARNLAPVSPEPFLVNATLVVDAAVVVDADWSRPGTNKLGTVAIVLGARDAFRAAIQAAVETVKAKNGQAVAEAVLSALGGSDADEITRAILADALNRANKVDVNPALKAEWEDKLQSSVGMQHVTGSVHVRPMAGMKSAVRVSE